MGKYRQASYHTEVLRLEGGQEVTLHIYKEYGRPGFRASMAKKGVIFRFPARISQRQYLELHEKGLDWVRKVFAKKPQVAEGYQARTYENGDTLTVGDRTYTIFINETGNKNHSGRQQKNGNVLKLSIAGSDSPEGQQKAISTLISRLVGQDYYPDICRRVDELNDAHFQVAIKDIKLKNTSSRWGSCSAKGNINLSTRLLFAPQKVVDYVIIHELAHRKEMNHSAKFWAIVAAVMPDYKEQERWLKENSGWCRF